MNSILLFAGFLLGYFLPQALVFSLFAACKPKGDDHKDDN